MSSVVSSTVSPDLACWKAGRHGPLGGGRGDRGEGHPAVLRGERHEPRGGAGAIDTRGKGLQGSSRVDTVNPAW